MYGDFGKVDLYSRTADTADDADALCTAVETAGNCNAAIDEAPGPDGKADNYQGRKAEACDPDDGGKDACDAAWSMDWDVTFADGIFGCSTTRMVTIKLHLGRAGRDPVPILLTRPAPTWPATMSAGNSNIGNFAKCTAS